MQPHIKLLKLSELDTKNKQIKFIQKNKNDTLFVQLLILATSPEYRFKLSERFNVILKSEPTIPTIDTFPMFRRKLFKFEVDKTYEDELLSYVRSLDSPSQKAYSVILNRSLLITIKDIYFLDYKSFTIRNEYPIDYGFPSFPCYVQLLPSNTQRINIYNDFGLTIVTTLEGKRIHIKEHIEDELQQLEIPLNSWLTGYLKDDLIYISDMYIDDIIFSKRWFLLDLQLEKHNFNYIRLVPTFKAESVDNLTDILQVCDDRTLVLTKQDKSPKFTQETLEQIYLNIDFIKELK